MAVLADSARLQMPPLHSPIMMTRGTLARTSGTIRFTGFLL
ncbi:hypothetical protein MGWOODY_Smn2655 [hydrothermal vent metagenome]|uniref:Uncharacterized protein n=1 Tax=hydrothermal vent metagenome TaxID=652676 RepID=A0A160TFP0_9ZZZZ